MISNLYYLLRERPYFALIPVAAIVLAFIVLTQAGASDDNGGNNDDTAIVSATTRTPTPRASATTRQGTAGPTQTADPNATATSTPVPGAPTATTQAGTSGTNGSTDGNGDGGQGGETNGTGETGGTNGDQPRPTNTSAAPTSTTVPGSTNTPIPTKTNTPPQPTATNTQVPPTATATAVSTCDSPTISINPTSIHPNMDVSMSASGFTPGSTVTVRTNYYPTIDWEFTFTADANGGAPPSTQTTPDYGSEIPEELGPGPFNVTLIAVDNSPSKCTDTIGLVFHRE